MNFIILFFLAACRSEYDLFQIELAKNYGVPEWREDLKKAMLKAGLENKPMVFLFSDTQVLNLLCYYIMLKRNNYKVWILSSEWPRRS